MILLTDLLKEVGEGTAKLYKWEELSGDDWNIRVNFTTDAETEYYVDMERFTSGPPFPPNLPSLQVVFLAQPAGTYEPSDEIVVNRGEMYRVMATIADIVKHYIKDAKLIVYTPGKKSGESFGTQRDKLYKAFITKALPGTEFKQVRDAIVAILPNK